MKVKSILAFLFAMMICFSICGCTTESNDFETTERSLSAEELEEEKSEQKEIKEKQKELIKNLPTESSSDVKVMKKYDFFFIEDDRGIQGDETEENYTGGFIFYFGNLDEGYKDENVCGSGYEYLYNSEESAKAAFESAQSGEYASWILQEGSKEEYTKSGATICKAVLDDENEDTYLSLCMILDGNKIMQFMNRNPDYQNKLDKIIKKLGY